VDALTTDLAMRVRELAERRGVSMSMRIVSILTEYLANVGICLLSRPATTSKEVK
jgi:hypothetical protein